MGKTHVQLQLLAIATAQLHLYKVLLKAKWKGSYSVLPTIPKALKVTGTDTWIPNSGVKTAALPE